MKTLIRKDGEFDKRSSFYQEVKARTTGSFINGVSVGIFITLFLVVIAGVFRG